LAMLGMAWSLELRGMQPMHPLPIKNKPPAKINMHFTGEKFGDNVQVFGPPNSKPVGSLILIMGYGADLSWTMSQWWYLHPAWSPKDQKWCKKSGCVFGDEDKVAAKKLTNHLRIVDAVGTIRLCKGMYAWYRYTKWPDGPPVVDQLEDAVANVFQLIEREYKIVGDYKRILIAGMSQGADLALEVGIRFPQQLGMVISQRGVLTAARLAGNQSLAAQKGTPFILTAGDSDELSPLPVYEKTCVSLQLMKYPAYCKWYGGLDHGSFSKPEWKLLINAFSFMLNVDPKAKQIDYMTSWWDSWRLDEKYKVLGTTHGA